MADTNQNLIAVIRAANESLYETRGMSSERYCAQAELSGRTHYVDDDTVRLFGCRIVSARPIVDGAFYRIMESSYTDWNKTKRGWTAVVFDVFGTIVYKLDTSDRTKTREAAERAYDQWRASFDPVAYYRQVFAERAERFARESQVAASMAERLQSVA